MANESRPPRIELRGVRVHNLQNLDLDLPLARMIVVTGVSGSGKTSLAFDTLYAEGQRRYVESFSTYSRRFLERFEKPDADRIEPIPPAVAVRQAAGARSRRATVGTATEIYDSLRLLFARLGVIECPRCGRRVERHSPASAQQSLSALEPGTRFMVCFPFDHATSGLPDAAQEPVKQGWPGLERSEAPEGEPEPAAPERGPRAKVDPQSATRGRLPGLPSGPAPATRSLPAARESRDCDTRLAQLAEDGFTRLIIGGKSVAIADASASISSDPGALVVVDRLAAATGISERLADSLELAFRHGEGACIVLVQQPVAGSAESADADRFVVDGVDYRMLSFNSRLICPGCGSEFADPEPALFNFNSPLGACPECRGIGEVTAGAARESPVQTCPGCRGARLRSEALAVCVGGRSIIDLTRLTAAELVAFVRSDLPDQDSEQKQKLSAQIVDRTANRLQFLIDVGLGYLTLDRPARSLSGGEMQRIRLTAAFGSRFVNLLYVLDEPTTGLHPHDTERLIAAIERLRDAGNTVVVVEHDATLIRRADEVIDIGPGAGREGGRIVFQGSPRDLAGTAQSLTADYLSGRRQVAAPAAAARRSPTGWLRLAGVEHHNLHGVAVDFPLGVLCVVTGVSGSGKSSLVEETLYPAILAGLQSRSDMSPVATSSVTAAKLPRSAVVPREAGRFASLTGIEPIENVVHIDQSPIGRSARANPASYLNLFGEIRALFAQTAEAKVKNFPAGHFSFNAAGGRCETCRGAGTIAVDMQFLPDVVTTCPDCHGMRYRREILEARYRGLSIAEVLNLTVRDAFPFFRGRTRLQRRLKVLRDVGLDYITLGQPADTLSGGESQRLKLAAFLSRASRARTLFIVDEPTVGLHPSDVARLLDCLAQILAGGHSLIVIEHNLDFVRNADYVIDLGPGAGREGGRVVATGTPAEIARVQESVTGRYLAK
jgi:excinuclease ABC subunit A